MKLLELTLPTPAENLALDEALLSAAELGEPPGEVLRLWEPAETFVVIGRSSQVAQEVRLEACRTAGVSVFRRSSGGAAIVTGPGCLMYAVVLSLERLPHLRAIDQAHGYVLERIGGALRRHQLEVELAGTSDLALNGRKFSGNSLRLKRGFLLYHGTLLYDFDLPAVEQLLRMPPRQPDYRHGRGHDDFLANLPIDSTVLCRSVIDAWSAREETSIWPRTFTEKLTAEKYLNPDWNFSR